MPTALVTLPAGTHILDGDPPPPYSTQSDPLDAAKNMLADLTNQLAALGAAIAKAEDAPPPVVILVKQELHTASDYMSRARADLRLYNLDGAKYCHTQASACIKAANAMIAEAGAYKEGK